jgi:hypothetical protein
MGHHCTLDVIVCHILEASVWMGLPHILEQLVTVLADKRLFVIARNVVPDYPVLVVVVEHGQAGLVVIPGQLELPVVGLAVSTAPSWTPVTLNPFVSGCHAKSDPGSGPKPTLDNGGLQVGTVLAVTKVALPTGSPNETGQAFDHSSLKKV